MKIRAITGLNRFHEALALAASAAFIFIPMKCHAVSSTNIFSLETGVATDNNVTAASGAMALRSDTIYNLALSGGRRFQLGPFDSLSAQLLFEENLYREYTGLSSVKGGVAAAWGHKFGIGPMRPVLTVAAAVTRRAYRYDDFNERRYEFATKLKKRLSDEVDVAAALELENHKAKDPDYNGNSRGLDLTVGIAAPADARVEFGYGTRRGAVTWYFTSPEPLAWNEVSDLFGLYYTRWVSRTRTISGTIIYPLGFDSSAFFGIERRNTTWRWRSYPENILKLGFKYNFY